MEWYRGAFERGLVNQEFVTVQKENQRQAIAQDKGGIVVTGLFEAKGYMALAESINADTEVEWALINDMTYADVPRSEEHTSELQSRGHLVCRLLLAETNITD